MNDDPPTADHEPIQGSDQLAVPNDPADLEALLVCIEPRRYVIVRHDGPQRLRPVEGGWEQLCRLQPGDRVIYEGTPTLVKAVEVY